MLKRNSEATLGYAVFYDSDTRLMSSTTPNTGGDNLIKQKTIKHLTDRATKSAAAESALNLLNKPSPNSWQYLSNCHRIQANGRRYSVRSAVTSVTPDSYGTPTTVESGGVTGKAGFLASNFILGSNIATLLRDIDFDTMFTGVLPSHTPRWLNFSRSAEVAWKTRLAIAEAQGFTQVDASYLPKAIQYTLKDSIAPNSLSWLKMNKATAVARLEEYKLMYSRAKTSDNPTLKNPDSTVKKGITVLVGVAAREFLNVIG